MSHTNLLAHEKSPYLLQHAHNPVDWMPWGEVAFARARAEEKPIFLSIGYSTCHWCHVMERESFENEATAALLNDSFISIKVDREERPDVDHVHMTYVQSTTGSGGWPMTVFLTPDLKPFFGGTYFPPHDAYGRIGFPELVRRVAAAWADDRDRVHEAGENVVAALREQAAGSAAPGAVDWPGLHDRCFRQLAQMYDERYGGFGNAPKFPRPVQHDFLHAYYALRGEAAARQMSAHTLAAMSDGGMNDQLGGGFHRYSVDEQWIVSHFEKMLYDQAQLVVSYLEMYQISGDDYYAISARNTLDYVLRDMTHPAGGFFSAEDADSLATADATHKDEGAFYVWTTAEIEALLGREAAVVFNEFYGVRPAGNAPAQGDPHGEFQGKNILYRAASLSHVAERIKQPPEHVAAIIQDAQIKLFEARCGRPRPHLDDKIITAWNGLMISAFARAAQALDAPEYLEAARRAADFIAVELFDADSGTLRRHYRDGAAPVNGFADDYAFLMRGLVDLYEASFEYRYLEWAETLADTLQRDFWDEAGGGGYFNSVPDPYVLLRMKEEYDGAEPAASSLAAGALVRLGHLLDRADLLERANTICAAFGARLHQFAQAMPALLQAKIAADTAPLHIVLVGKPEDDDTRALLRAVHRPFLPFKHVILIEREASPLAQRLPFVAAMKMVDGKATAYVCRDFACRQPVTTAQELAAQLQEA